MRRAWAIFAAVAFLGFGGKAFATPSTQIWIPSTDVQGFGVVHFGTDVYSTPFKGQSNGVNEEGGHNWINYGLTVGILPNDEKFGLEVGVDYRDFSLGGAKNPLLFNAKFGIKEGAFGEAMPAIAVGAYDFGTKSSSSTTDTADFRTDFNLMYGLVAKSFEGIGRISVGYFSGNDVSDVAHNRWPEVDAEGLPLRVATDTYYVDSLGRLRTVPWLGFLGGEEPREGLRLWYALKIADEGVDPSKPPAQAPSQRQPFGQLRPEAQEQSLAPRHALRMDGRGLHQRLVLRPD